MDYKHSCVIDANFIYKTFVLVILAESEEKPQYYELQEGEQLIDTAPPALRPHAGASGFIKAKWESGSWIEGATEEEITAWEEEHPAPELPEPAPTDTDVLNTLLGVI